MSYAQEKSPTSSVTGFAVVVLLHVLLGYVILSGLANRAIEAVKGPLEAKIIEEVKPPPPDTPPPPPPDLLPPPQVFVPPPEVVVQQQAPVVIQTVTNVAPPPSPPVPHPEAPPAPVEPDQDVSAKPIAGIPLKYPPRMQQQQREGSAVIDCTVDTTGHPSECKVVDARGGDAFGEAALEFVQAARYHPAIHNGKATTEKHQWKIDFKLQ
jgi:protein TonB